jgi:hypothetical protein
MVAFDRNDEGGEVAVADDLAELPFGAEPDAPATPRVQAVIAGRLGQLSQPAATLAGVAAAIGRLHSGCARCRDRARGETLRVKRRRS